MLRGWEGGRECERREGRKKKEVGGGEIKKTVLR